ncbi:hypothetical protein [Blastochloris tepida]|uniref:Uncharacterized protein n=1 Tax=Blastochloris tepida TaxID=2233851 RepID=A0A348FZE4_9HYPH|nr:hypothetical protein [Blastochloris tepida]BBF92677.1 hypothetical protein BLTE_13620 [Blastochloris tepida]
MEMVIKFLLSTMVVVLLLSLFTWLGYLCGYQNGVHDASVDFAEAAKGSGGDAR